LRKGARHRKADTSANRGKEKNYSTNGARGKKTGGTRALGGTAEGGALRRTT